MNIKNDIEEICRKAKEASRFLAQMPSQSKSACLMAMAKELEKSFDEIEEANSLDLEAGKKAGLSSALLDRLKLNLQRVKLMSEGLRQVAALNDPVGEIIEKWTRPNGIEIEKVRVPLGVIAIIYESRPNVTVDSAGLCFKSGNAVILRGGSEAIHTNIALSKILAKVLVAHHIPPEVIQLVETTDRNAILELLKMNGKIDLVIPRGGEGLIKTVAENTSIPVIKHYKGVCHVYVDASANWDMAEQIVLNAKVQRPGVCNAAETLLVHQDLKKNFLPRVIQSLQKKGVEIRACPQTQSVVKDLKEATQEDWSTEYLDLILSVKVVKDLNEAIFHINHYGSMHSDSIVTEDQKAAEKFLNEVDAACVYHNASTRFTDGFEFGFGAEIGISTEKIHARGPMGLRELTSYKYIVRGNGQIRS
ncbi:MAG: glutamate-5-semialdehyde dehydrogenase [Chlamydiae bacterium]|nr:glutamate-5-semialdehyde dehydrogenase [Chlamydiota bacterium]MBI3276436.1 glutamate-5-semialdehyde dehydrogenase [Chlamydiota bacterium]